MQRAIHPKREEKDKDQALTHRPDFTPLQRLRKICLHFPDIKSVKYDTVWWTCILFRDEYNYQLAKTNGRGRCQSGHHKKEDITNELFLD